MLGILHTNTGLQALLWWEIKTGGETREPRPPADARHELSCLTLNAVDVLQLRLRSTDEETDSLHIKVSFLKKLSCFSAADFIKLCLKKML